MVFGNYYIEEVIRQLYNEANSETITEPVLFSLQLIVYFVVTEFLPNFFALDYGFMMTYIKESSQETKKKNSSSDNNDLERQNTKLAENISLDINLNNPHHPNEETSLNLTLSDIDKAIGANINEYMIKSADFSLLELVYKTKNSFGSLYRGMFNNSVVMCRVVSFERLSRYDLESFTKDLEELL